MKIWCQSNTSIGIAEVFNAYRDSLQRHAKRVCRPDTIVEFHGQDKTFPAIDRNRASGHLAEHGAIRNAMRAEQQGFDVFVQITTPDGGIREIPTIVDIPLVFIAQTTLLLSRTLAPNFAFIAHNPPLYYFYPEIAERYGLKDYMIPGGSLNWSYLDFAKMWKEPKPYIEEFMKKAREIVARGAMSLFPVALPLSQWLIDQNIRDVDGATVLDPLGTALKMAEVMVDFEKLGIRRSRIGPLEPTPENVRIELRKEYGV